MADRDDRAGRADRAGRGAGWDRWRAVAGTLTWSHPWATLYEPGRPGEPGRWFAGGRLNLAVNCVDRHVDAGNGDRTAVHWEGEPGDRRAISYRRLRDDVAAMAGALRGLGVGVGDRVALHLGWLPETVVAMLACARIGAVHTVLPTPLPAEALAERLDHFGPKVLFTQDGAWRHGTILPLKQRADEALSAAGGVQHTVVVRRTGIDVAWYEGDRWLDDLLAAPRPGQPPPDTSAAELDAGHVVLSNPLASRRGRTVSALHGAANLLASVTAIHRYALAAGHVSWCAAEISWLGAQSHGVLGPLACGDTAVMYEGMLDVPTRTRAWDLVRRYQVHTLVTTPSVIRHLRGWSGQPPAARTVTSLRRVVLFGEPAGRDLLDWLSTKVGRGQLAVADGWGQTELGGIVTVLGGRPVDPQRLPDPGFAIVDQDGHQVPDGGPGELVLRRPWAGLMRGLEGAGAEETVRRRWRLSGDADGADGVELGPYCTEDTVCRRPDGGLEFLGRTDEVINVSGQLVSLGEVREVLLQHPFVAAAEVVQQVDRRLGRSLAAAVVPAAGVTGDPALARDLLDSVRELLGGLARPRALLFVDRFAGDLPPAARRRALEALAAPAGDTPVHLTWEQVLAAAPPQ